MRNIGQKIREKIIKNLPKFGKMAKKYIKNLEKNKWEKWAKNSGK